MNVAFLETVDTRLELVMHLQGDKVHYRGQQGVREGIIPRAIHTGYTFIEEIVSK